MSSSTRWSLVSDGASFDARRPVYTRRFGPAADGRACEGPSDLRRRAAATGIAGSAGSILRPWGAALLLGATLLALAPTTQAAATSTPEHVSRYIDDARPAGSGRLTWFGLHVYDARLFVPRTFDASDPAAQPFALEITYARRLEGRAIAERSHDEITRLGLGSAAQRGRWLEQMTALFPNVRAGQRLAGIYRPGGATRFYVDGRALGEIDDPEFGRAFFAIWLDPRTSAPQLRASLLSQAP